VKERESFVGRALGTPISESTHNLPPPSVPRQAQA